MKKLLILVNSDWFFLSHRLPIAKEAISQGIEVHIGTINTGRKAEIESHGIIFHELPIERASTDPFTELNTLWAFYKLFKKVKPDISHHITPKAVVYGAVCARLRNVPQINAVSGMGYLFTSGRQSKVAKMLLKLLSFGWGNKKQTHVIFQNPDDLEQMKSYGLLHNVETTIIKGSGVNLDDFSYTPLPTTNPKLLVLPARMLFDKGIKEFKKAANILQEKWEGKIKFILAGKLDDGNPSAISKEEIESWNIPNYFEWVGFQKDIKTLLQKSYITVLPSYREGLPKSLIDASAIGRPLVTTDTNGCRECVIENYNGSIVPVQSITELATAIEKIVENKELAEQMSINSRKFAENNFSIKKVVKTHLELYFRYI
ncbi:MAG: glycosyltransferase family 4 protein [Flavobacteriales bacterium]|jgi:glycosyltransferase involved in cell wall biosynthesis|nr:glycosyltransferase family 4 protein [Flavobacteriales bacterium]